MKRYQERLRPQFHFTAEAGWLNDPNGLVYHAGEYHLFFQHNPSGTGWGNMTWGHAVSRDLVHWEQLANALEPDAMGMMFSGTAVVDWQNTAGFGKETLVAFYTAAGHCLNPPVSDTQCLAYSTDRGRPWAKYAGNPVLQQITPGNRDPKVFWWSGDSTSNIEHSTPNTQVGGYWVMVLYVEVEGAHTFQFFRSDDLKSWEFMSQVDGFFECPDLLELDGRWVLFGADGQYVVGQFDGREFRVTSGKHVGDWGPNFYAAQTWNDMPAADGRRIVIGWMRGGSYPDMPFNQQMTFPCELTLRDGRLCKWPVREIESLVCATHDRPEFDGELVDLETEIEPGNAIDCGFKIRGHDVRYLPGEEHLVLGRHAAPLPLVNGRIRLRILVDRSSVEVFGNGGRVVLSTCFLPPPDNFQVQFYANGGAARLHGLQVRELKSAWETGG